MVALTVWPTDGSDGSVATEARWRKMARHWQSTGVVPVGGFMAPTLAGTNLTVQDGAAWVDGHFAELPGAQVLTVTANGIVVVRFDPAANTAELVYRDGVTVPAQSPTGVYEMLIASVAGSVLTDRRRVLSVGGAPWDVAWGAVGQSPLVTASQTGLGTTPTNLTGLTCTFPALVNRRYRMELLHAAYHGTAQGVILGNFGINGAGIKDFVYATGLANLQVNYTTAGAFTVATAGTKTATVALWAQSGVCANYATPTNPSIVTVTDLGPVPGS